MDDYDLIFERYFRKHQQTVKEKLDSIDRALDKALLQLQKLNRRMEDAMASLDDLVAQVTNNTSVVNSALTLIQGLEAQIVAAGTDPTKLQALVDELNTTDTALAAAVAANTPPAPAPVVAPVDPNAPPVDPNAPPAAGGKRR